MSRMQREKGHYVTMTFPHAKQTSKVLAMITLPWPPTVNTYYRNVNGRAIMSKKGREYVEAVSEAVVRQGCGGGFAGSLDVEILAYPPDRRKRDLDNLFKATLDAMGKAGVYGDDSQINVLRIVRRDPDTMKRGFLNVTIQEAA